MKVDRVRANHSLRLTASQGTSNIPFHWFLLLGYNRQAQERSTPRLTWRSIILLLVVRRIMSERKPRWSTIVSFLLLDIHLLAHLLIVRRLPGGETSGQACDSKIASKHARTEGKIPRKIRRLPLMSLKIRGIIGRNERSLVLSCGTSK